MQTVGFKARRRMRLAILWENKFFRCFVFGPVLAAAVTLTHFLTTGLCMSVYAIFIDQTLKDALYMALLSSFIIGLLAAHLAVPFSIILFLISRYKGLTPRLAPTASFSVIAVFILDLIGWPLIFLFGDERFTNLVIVVYVAIVFFSCLAVAVFKAIEDRRT